jgi:hypothetical protein
MALLVAGCGGSSGGGGGGSSGNASAGPFSLTLSGSGYGPHVGQTLHVALVNDATNAVVATDSFVVASSGAISYTFAAKMTKGGTYRLDFYADYNTNGACDAYPTDHAWRVAVTDANGDGTNDVSNLGTATAVNNDVAITRNHDVSFTNVCASFP